MAVQGMVVPVSLQISNLQAIINEIQSKMSNLKVGSGGFRALETSLKYLQKELDSLQVQAQKPFMTENQFNSAQKSVGKLEDEFNNLQLKVNRIKFSDLNLNPDQQAQLKALQDEVVAIQNSLKSLKETAKQEFLGSDLGKVWKEIDPTASTKSLDQITSNIRRAVLDQKELADQAKEVWQDYAKATSLSDTVEKALKTKNPLENLMSSNEYNSFFSENKNGVLSFKSGQKPVFEQWLIDNLQVDPNIAHNLVQQSANQIREELKNAQSAIRAELNTKIKPTARTDESAAKTDYDKQSASLLQLQDILNRVAAAYLNIDTNSANLKQRLAENGVSADKLRESFVQAAQAELSLGNNAKAVNTNLDTLKTTLDSTNASFLQQQRITQSFNSMKMAVVNFMGFNQVLNITRRAVREAINHIKELDTVMNGIAIVTDMSTGDLWTQIDQYSKMAQAYGVSITGAYEVSQIYYQQGLETADVMTLTNETLKLAKISGLDYATTTDYMTTAIRGFKMEMADAATVVDVYSNLAAHTAVSQEELAVAMSKTASSMEGVGATFEEASAMIGTMVAVTRESATNIGSAMKSIASRYGELTKDPTKLVDEEGEAMVFNKVDAALQSVGISMRTVDGQFREFTDVIVELGEKWDQLDSTQQRYIATQFAGNRQQSRFLALVSNVDLLKSNLDVAMNSEDTGTLQALKALDSIQSKTEQVRVAYQQFYTTIGIENVWKGFLDGAKNVINTLNSFPKLFGKLPVGAIAAVTNIINVIKTLGVKAINGIAEMFGPALLNGLQAAQSNAQSGAEGIFTTILNTLKGKISQAKEAGIETGKAYAEGANQGAVQQKNTLKPEELNGQKAIQYGQLTKTINNLKGIKNSEFIEDEIIQMSSSLTQDQLQTIYGNQNGLSAGINEVINKLIQERTELLKVGNAAEQSNNKLQTFASKHQGLANGLQSFGSALQMASMMIDTSKPGMKTLSGTLMSISGAATMASIAMKALSAAANGTKFAMPWMAVISGIFALINGISTLIITPEEKLKELEDRAEDLNNKSKEAKAEYKTLDNSIKKIDELKEKRYESAEAAEEYQTAVDELADKFPQMIAGFDEAGNIILDTTDAERILAEARNKSKEAAYAAAEAELKKAQEQKNQAKSALKEAQGQLEVQLFTDTSDEIHSVERRKYFNTKTYQDANGINRDVKDLITEGDFLNTLYSASSLGSERELTADEVVEGVKEFNEALQKIGNQAYSFISEFTGTTAKELYSYMQTYKSQHKVSELTPEFFEIEQLINEELQEQINTAYQSTVKEINKLKDLDVNDQNFDNQIQIVNQAIHAYQDLVGENSVEFTRFDNVIAALGDVNAAMKDYINMNEIYQGNSRAVISAWQQSATANSEAWDVLSKSSFAAALATEQIVQEIGNGNYEELVKKNSETKKWRAYQEEIAEFISKMNEDTLLAFNQMGNDTANYTAEDIIEQFNIQDDKIKSYIIDHYNNGIASIQKRLRQALSQASGNNYNAETNSFDNVFKNDFYRQFDIITHKQLTTTEEKYLNNILSQYNSIQDNGYTARAAQFGQSAIDLFNEISEAPANIEKQLWQLINEKGLTTLEGIQQIQNTINNNAALQGYINKDTLMQFYNNIIPNINLEIQTTISNLLETWEDTSKELSSALSSGVSLKEADALITKAKSLGLKDFSLNNFQLVGDKLVLIGESWNNYYNKLTENITLSITTWQTRIDQANKAFSAISNYGQSTMPTNVLQDYKAALEAIGFTDWNNREYVTQWGTLTEEGKQHIQDLINNTTDELTEYSRATAIATRQLLTAHETSQGIYKLIINKVETNLSEDLKKLKIIAKGGTLGGNALDERAIKDSINNAYNTFISDVLSKGFENIRIEDYEGLVNAKDIQLRNISYEQFIKDYIDYMGVSIDEANNLLAQAIEKDREKFSSEALTNLQFINQNQFAASLSDLTELANRFDIGLGQLTTNWDQALGAYIVDFTQFKEFNNFTDVENYQAIINDSVNEFFSNLVNLVKSALSGSLSNTDRGQLDQWAADYNEKFGANLKLDFTKTAEGLKMSEDSAIGLYSALKQVDTLQASLVFDELNKSLQESNEHYNSISAIEARIVELRTLKDTTDPTKKEQYATELALAEEIRAVRSTTEDSSFSFMSNKIPGGQNNPLNYWKNWGDAWKTLEESSKSGTMDYTAFYNIITEMGNLAEKSGAITVGAGTVLNNSQDAANLIEAAAASLRVDANGALTVDLSNLANLGFNFEAAGADMSKGVEAGIKEMAQSQVDMLDSMIQLMETIVAMEQLGDLDVDGNGLNIGDLFNITYDKDGSIKSWDKEFKGAYKDSREEMLRQLKLKKGDEGFNKDLQDGLTQTLIGNGENKFSLADLLNWTPDDFMQEGHEEIAKIYPAILQAYSDAARSGNYSLDNIWSSIKEVLAGNTAGFEGDIDIGDLHLTVSQGIILERDKDGNFIVNGKPYTTAEAAIQAQQTSTLGEFINATKETNPETGETTYTAGTLKATVIYNAESKTYHINFSDGTSADAPDEASAKFALKAWAQMNGTDLSEVGDGKEVSNLSFTYHAKAGVVVDIEADITTGEITYTNKTNISGPEQAKAIQEVAASLKQVTVPIKAEGEEASGKQTISIGIEGDDAVNEALENILKKLEELREQTDISITISDDTAGALAELQTNLINSNADPITKEIKAIITDYANGENADPNTLVNNLQGILTGYENQISEEQKKAIEGLIGIITQIQTDPNITLPEIKDLVTNLTLGANEPKDALNNNTQKAKEELIQNIKLKTNETGAALQDNLEAKDVNQDIINTTNDVIATIDANVTYAKNHPAVQSVEGKGGASGGHGFAKGNVNFNGAAQSKGTLMGELGPELVVSNGRYFVAGQNGPEMIDLADDAIVFNHLQTKSLLEKGTSPGRGKVITNERNAVAFATGNINGGPAMASASAALQALKQLRAQWQALAGLSVQDLAGKGGGGGGGGGGDPKAFVKDLERWYNWLQQIAQLEKEINLEEAKRSRYQSSMVSMGREYADSQLVTLDKLKQEVAIQHSLNESKGAFFEKRRTELNEESAFKALYRFDENGQLKYKPGQFEWLSDLVGRDSVTGEANYTAKEQYERLVAAGYGEQMKYDASGNEIKQEGDDWYVTAIQAFWDKIEAERQEMQSLHDDVLDGQVKEEELMTDQNEILNDIEDNQIAVEDKVLKAVEETRQREIDAIQDEKDAIEKSSQALITGLSDQLSKEQDMYSRQQDSNELSRLQRQLSILQRSGGSASQIASLQKDITERQQDAYFDAQKAQIDALQEASDNQLQKLQEQIDLMTEQLAYEKEHGMLWEQVYQVMAQSPEQITEFITKNTEEYWGKSPADFAEDSRDVLFQAEQFVQMRENVKGGLAALVAANSPEAIAAESEKITAESEATQASTTDTALTNTNTTGTTDTSSNDSDIVSKYYQSAGEKGHYLVVVHADGSKTESDKQLQPHTFKDNKCTKCYYERKGGGTVHDAKMFNTHFNAFATRLASGGLITKPTYSLVGETGKPEAVLNPEQTAILRNEILSNKPNSALSMLSDLRELWNAAERTANIPHANDASVIIENATVEMNVSRIANDYDAQRAGEQALDQMLAIARRTQAQNRVGR